MADGDQRDDAQAVIAHELLNAMTTVAASLAMLRRRWDDLSASEHDDLVHAALRQARQIEEVLVRLAQGLPADALALLDGLQPEA